MQPVFQDFLLLLNLHVVVIPKHFLSVKLYKIWMCLPSILLLPSHLQALTACPFWLPSNTSLHLFHLKHGWKSSLLIAYTKPDSSLNFYHGFLFYCEDSRNLKLPVLSFYNDLSSSACTVEWVQSFRVLWGKQLLQNWQKSHGNKLSWFRYVFLLAFLSPNLTAIYCIKIHYKYLMTETVTHFVFAQ